MLKSVYGVDLTAFFCGFRTQLRQSEKYIPTYLQSSRMQENTTKLLVNNIILVSVLINVHELM